MSKGFFHPVRLHTVCCVGEVYRGRNARDALRAVRRWRKFAAGSEGRAVGQVVEHFIDGVLQRQGEDRERAEDQAVSLVTKKGKARGKVRSLKQQVAYVVRFGGQIQHEGRNRRNAEQAFAMWRNFARAREGAPKPKLIELIADGQTLQSEEVR